MGHHGNSQKEWPEDEVFIGSLTHMAKLAQGLSLRPGTRTCLVRRLCGGRGCLTYGKETAPSAPQALWASAAGAVTASKHLLSDGQLARQVCNVLCSIEGLSLPAEEGSGWCF